jgi:uncharacterized repeat protein (TIGR03803 family)
MHSNKPYLAAKIAFAFFVTFVLASVVAPAQSQAQTFTVLHTFQGAPDDGAFPWTQLTRDAEGNLYGTTEQGGDANGVCSSFFYGCGTAFKLNKTGKLLWLHSFNSKDGGQPMAGLLRDTAGELYGTTVLGGDTNCYEYGCGTAFKLDKTGKETVLHKFSGTPDGEWPEGLLVQDKAGNVYGTTILGGTGNNGGTAFKIDKKGHKTVLYSFCSETDCRDGRDPFQGVILDAAGNLYGAASYGGVGGSNAGVVYRIDSTGQETVLYTFSGGSDGGNPASVLISDGAGNLYGTTEYGGNSDCGDSGCGVVFELSPQSNGGWTGTTLYTFCSLANCADGEYPLAGPLVRDSAGNLYGTTEFGGTPRDCASGQEGCGVVFKLDTSGRETVLHTFTLGSDGGIPATGLIMDKLGNLYGVADAGGDLNCAAGSGQGCGVVFEITP